MPNDLSNLSDEELDKKIAEVTAEEGSEVEPEEPILGSEEEEEQEEQLEEENLEQEEEEQEEEEPKKQPSRREQLRVNQLLEKMKQARPSEAKKPQSGVDYRKLIEADEDTYKALEEASQQSGQQAYNEGLEQAKSIQFHTRLEIDAPRVEAKYPQLDKSSDKFNPALADAVNSWYLQTTGYDSESDRVANPNIRYSEFVEAVFELGNTIGSEKSEATARNVAKQAATTGLRPDGSQAKRLNLNKAPQAMSDEELDAFLKREGLATQK